MIDVRGRSFEGAGSKLAEVSSADLEIFVHRQNLEHLRKLLAGTTEAVERGRILEILAEEEAKPFIQ